MKEAGAENFLLFPVCDLPYQPSNGELSLTENGYRVTYSCHLDYSLSGVSTRLCTKNGTGWDGQDPACGKTPIFY